MARPTQPNLFTGKAKTTSHANLGKGFEGDIERTNEYYRRRGVANVKKNPQNWKVVSYNEYQKALKEKLLPKGMFAKTENGLYMIRAQSDIDYTGPALGHPVEFDAKTTKGVSIPLDNFHEHQIRNLMDSERAGAVAGFMIEFSEKSRVFFARASLVRRCSDDHLYRRGRSSIPMDFLIEHAVEIPLRNELVDWLPALVPKQI